MHAWSGRRSLPLLVVLLSTLAALVRAAPAASQGSFTLLTYNVAGLPVFVSQSDPFHNMPQIGKLMNLYDVAVVQEDFAYDDDLNTTCTHAYRTPALVPNEKIGIGDGLNVFSRLPFSGFERVAWRTCNGRFSNGCDCLAPKGFTFQRVEVARGADIDLYDLHMDSGNAPGDITARALQSEQLVGFIEKHSTGHAVIVAGDTNMGRESEGLLDRFLARTGLADACRILGCGKPDLIDRVMYRSAASLELSASHFVVDPRFVRNDGKALSDHDAVGVVMRWAQARVLRRSRR